MRYNVALCNNVTLVVEWHSKILYTLCRKYETLHIVPTYHEVYLEIWSQSPLVSSTVHFMLKNSDLCLYITHTTLSLFKLGAKLKIFIQETNGYLLQVHSLFHFKVMIFLPAENSTTHAITPFTHILCLPFTFCR